MAATLALLASGPNGSSLSRANSRPVRADLRPVAAHVGGVEPHRDDGVGALALGLLDHSFDHLLATVREGLRHALQLAAHQRLQPGAELRADVAGTDGQAEDLAERLRHVVAGQVVRGRDQHWDPPWSLPVQLPVATATFTSCGNAKASPETNAASLSPTSALTRPTVCSRSAGSRFATRSANGVAANWIPTHSSTDPKRTVSSTVSMRTPAKPAASNSSCSSSGSASECSLRFARDAQSPKWPSTASARAPAAGFRSIGVNTLAPARPAESRTRRISPTAAGLSGKNWRPSWQSTTSNSPSPNGNPSALPSCHSIGAPSAAGRVARATASIPAFRSTPATRPPSPTRAAARRATTPVPQATSSTRAPGDRPTRSARSSAHGSVTAGTR